MSKIEAEKFELSHEDFDFEKMLQKIINVINFRVEEKKQRLSVRIDRNIPGLLSGDSQRLSQVIANLLSNAVKFTPEAGSITLDAVLLDAGLDDADDPFCTLQISVTDTGIGIKSEQQEKLFNSFVQAESSTTRRFGGTGLGLAISRHIVEMMNGKIWLESELDKGSTFVFTVRLKRAGELPRINLPGNLRILAVSGDEETRLFFSGAADRYGIQCDTAISGGEALALQRNKTYDMYFTDWKLPDIDASALACSLGENETKAKPVVALISSFEWNVVEREAKEAGITRFLPNPLFPSVFAACINECLRQEMSEQNADAAGTGETERFEGYHVLIVDDIDINREILVTLLESTGLEMSCAENGAEAVKMYTEHPDRYDLIFMDVQMPEMDGYEATGRIRAFEAERQEKDSSLELAQQTPRQLLESPAGLPIIAMTANVFKEDIERCLAAKMNDHIGKPVEMEEVIAKLKKYLVLKKSVI
jgi:CheY-like chemotaxis protein